MNWSRLTTQVADIYRSADWENNISPILHDVLYGTWVIIRYMD